MRIFRFLDGDTGAHPQFDAKALTLTKRLSLAGTRYKGEGVTLAFGRAGPIRLRHAKRPVTACEPA